MYTLKVGIMSHESKPDLALAHEWGQPGSVKWFSYRRPGCVQPGHSKNDNASPKAGIVSKGMDSLLPGFGGVHDHLREGDLDTLGIEGQLHLLVEVEPDTPVITGFHPGAHHDIY